jgi:hypothetical protein
MILVKYILLILIFTLNIYSEELSQTQINKTHFCLGYCEFDSGSNILNIAIDDCITSQRLFPFSTLKKGTTLWIFSQGDIIKAVFLSAYNYNDPLRGPYNIWGNKVVSVIPQKPIKSSLVLISLKPIPEQKWNMKKAHPDQLNIVKNKIAEMPEYSYYDDFKLLTTIKHSDFLFGAVSTDSVYPEIINIFTTLIFRKSEKHGWQLSSHLTFNGSPFIDIDGNGFPEFISYNEYMDCAIFLLFEVYPQKSEPLSSLTRFSLNSHYAKLPPITTKKVSYYLGYSQTNPKGKAIDIAIDYIDQKPFSNTWKETALWIWSNGDISKAKFLNARNDCLKISGKNWGSKILSVVPQIPIKSSLTLISLKPIPEQNWNIKKAQSDQLDFVKNEIAEMPEYSYYDDFKLLTTIKHCQYLFGTVSADSVHSEFDEYHTLIFKKYENGEWKLMSNFDSPGDPALDVDGDGFPEFLSYTEYTDSGGYTFIKVYPQITELSRVSYASDF